MSLRAVTGATVEQRSSPVVLPPVPSCPLGPSCPLYKALAPDLPSSLHLQACSWRDVGHGLWGPPPKCRTHLLQMSSPAAVAMGL